MTIELARERLTHLFQFFKAVEERRTPKVVDVNKHKWVMWLESLPKHSKLKLITPSPENGEWLVIQKPPVAYCPPYPEALNEWLDTGWDDPSTNLHQRSKSEPYSVATITLWFHLTKVLIGLVSTTSGHKKELYGVL
jgi:hypothetical protein